MSKPVDMIEQEKTMPAAAPAAQDTVKRDDTAPVHEKTDDAPADKKTEGPKWLPKGARDSWQRVGDGVTRMRTASIMATPAPIINNASNVLGAMHVATEMLMFKSGMKDNKLIDNPSNPVNWVWEPYKKIKADILSRGAARDYSLPQLFRGDIRKNFKTYVMDTHAASHRELDRQIASNRELVAVGKSAKPLSLGNPWQTRTTGMGIVIWLLSTVIPERKESDEEIERMAKMRTLHPMQYIGTRLKQAVWLPEWMTHKREMLGLGYLGIGILSGFGSWRNRGDLAIGIVKDAELIQRGVKQGYKFNGGYFATAVVSFLAGLPLLFALDERKAYSSYGSISMARIPALPSSLYSKIKYKESGWQFYTAGKLLFQIEDFLFSLIGGAEKRVKPDGTVEIIDHEKLKQAAIKEAKQEKARMRDDPLHPAARLLDTSVSPIPHTTISHADVPERAMPERAAAAEQKKDAAAVAAG